MIKARHMGRIQKLRSVNADSHYGTGYRYSLATNCTDGYYHLCCPQFPLQNFTASSSSIDL
ncbi:uncharacterized protein DS421_4g118800 [Arachis hypogaea]|nr:uncharacterized protein DS421_4g118800 [Arachis hypogaea]